jgi:hypothetical protein
MTIKQNKKQKQNIFFMQAGFVVVSGTKITFSIVNRMTNCDAAAKKIHNYRIKTKTL